MDSSETAGLGGNSQVTMADFQFMGSIQKFNDHNYSSWQTIMRSHLEGQELKQKTRTFSLV